MANKQFYLALVVVIAVIIASFYYGDPVKLVDVPLTSLKEDLDVTTLDNGMIITIKEMRASPLVTIQFWVHIGAKNEPREFKGIAHIFEHMWFKGTATQPVGSFDKRVESLGGELNAMTSHDWTLYYVTVPADKFDDIFPYMVDLLLNPLFDEHEIEKEKEVVVEEQRFSFNEPERYVDDQFGLLLIDEHPYRHPVIGYKDTIMRPTREDIIAFYNQWYVPNNMNLIIVGGIDRDDILRKATDALSHLESRPLPQQQRPIQLSHSTPRYNSSFRDLGYTYVEIGYIAPDSTDDDRYAMQVLHTIFAVGDSSRLERIVKKEKNLIVRKMAAYPAFNELGVFAVLSVIEQEKSGAAKAELLLQLTRFKTELVTDEELKRAKTQILVGRVKSQEEIFQVGLDIGSAWIDGDINDYSTFISNINAVTKADIKQVANKYLTAYTMYELKPKL